MKSEKEKIPNAVASGIFGGDSGILPAAQGLRPLFRAPGFSESENVSPASVSATSRAAYLSIRKDLERVMAPGPCLVAEMVGFEPTCLSLDKTISSHLE